MREVGAAARVARRDEHGDAEAGQQGGGQRLPHYFRLKRLSLHVVQFKDRVAHSSVSCVATVVSCVATVGPSPGGILDAGSGAPEHRSPPANQVRGTSTVPSRSKMSRDAAPGPAGRSDAGAQEAYGPSAGGSVTDLLDPAAEPPQAVRPSGRTRGRVMRNWRVRSRLVLLITIPTATAVAIGGSSIASSWRSAVADQRITQLATLVSKVTTLSYQLQYERFDTVQFIGTKTDLQTGNLESTLSASAKDRLRAIRQQYKYTDKWIGLVTASAAATGSGLPRGLADDVQSVKAELARISSVRHSALSAAMSSGPAASGPTASGPAAVIDVLDRYSAVIGVLLAFEDEVLVTSNDPQLTSTFNALSQISALENEYSVQRSIVVYAVTAGTFAPDMFDMLNASIANQKSDNARFLNFASDQQKELYKVALATGEWFGNVRQTIGKIRGVELTLVAQAVDRAQQLRKKSIILSVALGGAGIIKKKISLMFTVLVGRSMVRPLRRLRAGALEVAGLRLPETVRRMSEAVSENIPIDVEPIDVDSFDEIGEVARAFDQVHREALRLAANEAALRGNVNAMFVNLSRRSQSLVERQIRLIDELEQGEQDPERLGSLFQMDHLATRMRRNSENLLVLAGHDSTRRWNQPVALVDVLRAAISEIEQYERVTLNVQPGIAVRGLAVNDVVHLIAELAENATSYSSADTPVSVSGHLLSSGGVLLDITDLGVGMGSEEMAHANWRLDNPPVVDVAVSRRMGLFVVARLAARHGIRVRLRPASGAGLTALVWLPDEVVARDGAARQGGLGRFPEPLARFAIGSGPAGIAGPGGSGGPVPVGSEAGGQVGSGEWPTVGTSTAEQEVAAARAPRFAPPPQDDPGTWLGPQRVPGVGPNPGQFEPTSTTPIPAVGADSPSEPAAYGGEFGQQQPGVAGSDVAGEAFGTVPTPAFGTDYPSSPSQPVANEWSAPSGVAGTDKPLAKPAAAAGAAGGTSAARG